tara:strand:+ start:31 stop:927 length:897 start_codon:yes stop_codon:yes gene_type:complete
MPLQKKKKKPKPASDKSVKQVVTQIVKVNIGDTKPKKKRKRKTGGGVARSAAPPPMLAQVPQQFIYPPQSFPQEAQMAPQRPQSAAPAGVQVPDPFPVSALNRVLGSVPRSTLASQPEVQRPTLLRGTSEQIRVPSGFVGQPPPILKDTPAPKISPPPSVPEPFGIGPSMSIPPVPKEAAVATLSRDSGSDNLVESPMMMANPYDPTPAVGRGRSSDKLIGFDPSTMMTAERAAERAKKAESTRRSRSRSKSRDPNDPPKLKPGPKPGSKNKVRQVPGQQGIGKYIQGQAEDVGQSNF